MVAGLWGEASQALTRGWSSAGGHQGHEIRLGLVGSSCLYERANLSGIWAVNASAMGPRSDFSIRYKHNAMYPSKYLKPSLYGSVPSNALALSRYSEAAYLPYNHPLGAITSWGASQL